MKLLREAGLPAAAFDNIAAQTDIEPYHEGRHDRLLETLLAGAAGGAVWGLSAGPSLVLESFIFPYWVKNMHRSPCRKWHGLKPLSVPFSFAGSIVGGMVGTFMGWGIDGGDMYRYNESQQRAQVLLKVETDPSEATEAAQIMAHANREARSRGQHVIA